MRNGTMIESGPAGRGRLAAFWRSLTAAERRTVLAMAAVIVLLHAAGFGIIVGLVAPHRYALGASEVFTVGLGITAWTLGLRHAFDADHIAAIDNTTRKLMHEGRRPLSAGFWFSLGHSTIVFALSFLLALGLRSLAGPVQHSGSSLHTVTGWLGTLVSGSFLYLIAALNIVTLAGIVAIFRQMRTGHFDEDALERRLAERGLLNRVLGRVARAVSTPRQLYPVGVLFGLGFDTATEVGLLGLSAAEASKGLSLWSVLVFPVLFAAGMSLVDSTDNILMLGAYGWAYVKPIRKLYYNITITSVSVVVAFAVGGIEALGLLSGYFHPTGGFWNVIAMLNDHFNSIGFIIIGVFIVAWVGSVIVYRYLGYDELEVKSAGAPEA